jgi:hypothetical protein
LPIQKFRSVADMPRPLGEGITDNAELRRRIAALWARAARISPRVYPRGVFKFRSLEEANQARERVTTENIARLVLEREEKRSRSGS